MSASDTVYIVIANHDAPVPTSHVCGVLRQKRGLTADVTRIWIRYLEQEGHLRRVDVDGRECWECVPESWATYTGDPVGVP